MNQNNEPDWRTGGRADGRTSGLANARTRTNGRNNCSTRQEMTATTAWTMGQVLEWTMEAAAARSSSTQQQQQRLGPLDLLGDLRPDKNKKCRQGGCMQHLVFAWPGQAGQGRKGHGESRNRYSLAKTLQDAAVCHVLCVSASVAA